MALSKEGLGEIPEETKRIAQAVHRKGNVYMQVRDELDGMVSDAMFADLYAEMGRPSVSPSCLVLVLIMQYMAGYSDRQAAEAARDKISWKYALSLEMTDVGFDASILSDFRGRLLEHEGGSRLFEQVLSHLSEKALLKGHLKQRSDATHVIASVRNLNRLELVGESLRSCLNRLAQVDPEWLGRVLPQSWIDRYSRRFDEWHLPKQEMQRQALAEQIGQDGMDLLTMLYSQAALSPLRSLKEVEIVRQIWLQQFYWDEADQVRLRDPKQTPQGAQLIQSPFDVEARYTHQVSGKRWLGYKTHWTETCDPDEPRIITHVLTTVATDQDVGVTQTIQRDLIAKNLAPQEHYLDAAYCSVDNLIASHEQTIDLLAPLKVNPSWQARQAEGLDITQFHIDWQQQQVRCPQGVVSTTWSHSQDAHHNAVIHVRFPRKECQACPLKARCTQSQARSLKFYPQQAHETMTQHRQRQVTPEFQEKYQARAGIEGTFSWATRTTTLRRTPFVGLQKTHFHTTLTAIALNVQRAIAWLNEVPIATTRKSPLRQFQPAS